MDNNRKQDLDFASVPEVGATALGFSEKNGVGAARLLTARARRQRSSECASFFSFFFFFLSLY